MIIVVTVWIRVMILIVIVWIGVTILIIVCIGVMIIVVRRKVHIDKYLYIGSDDRECDSRSYTSVSSGISECEN